MGPQNQNENTPHDEEPIPNSIQPNNSATNAKGGTPSPSVNLAEAEPNEAALGVPGLLEELRRVQNKLLEIEERTQRDSIATKHANDTMSFITGMGEVKFNPAVGMHDPVSHVTKFNQILGKTILPTDDIFALQSYMRLARGRLEYQYMSDLHTHELFERDLERYYLNRRSMNRVPLDSPIDIRSTRIEWNEWEARKRSPQEKRYVIDVLIGEPNLSSPFSAPLGPRNNANTAQYENESAAPKEAMIPGEGPLPERIRIHSILLVRLLFYILNPSAPPPPQATRNVGLIMVRPFKYLTFFQNQIQKWYDVTQEELKADDNPISESMSGEPTVATKAPGSQSPSNGQNKNYVLSPLKSKEACAHLRCLLDFIHAEISSKQKYLEQDCEKISFVELWHLFKPGTEVVEAGDRHTQCYRVVKVTSPKHRVDSKYSWFFRNKVKGETAVAIQCVYVDFDGRFVGPVSKKFDITRYEGLRDIKSLPVYPLRFEDDGNGLRQRLINRGRRFLRAMQVGHMHYTGFTLESRDEIDSQVVIDFTEALASRENHKDDYWKPNVQGRARAEDERERVQRDNDSDSDSDSDSDDGDCDGECCRGEFVYDDNFVDTSQSRQYLSNLLEKMEEDNPPLAVIARSLQKGKELQVTDDDLVIMPYRVFGFVLRSRSWAKLDLANLMDLDEYRRKQEIESPTGGNRSENVFDNLVFPKDGLDRKKIVRSLVAQHFQDRESATSREEQRDIVRGKGKGLIILLHGAPGVGKTTTAEGIAELFNKPLFQITCGDLGTTAKEVEAALETNFSLANKWGSILLLDEADVFLARRTPHDFQRNGLVAVFLRVLEYYAGILFLTTNRIGDFDEAFSSRIHISLHYPALDYDSTVDVFDLNWRLMKARFKHTGRDLEIDESKITASLAEYWHKHPNARWNGRQIRNACQTALALAEFEAQTGGDDGVVTNPFAKVHLGVSHMKTVSDAYLEFIKYLQDVRDADQEKYAFLQGIRRQEARDIPLENPLAYGSPSPLNRGQINRLTEHRAKSAARYNRSEQGHYLSSTSYTNIGGDQPGQRPGSSVGGAPGTAPYQYFSRQTPGVGMGPYQYPPQESHPQPQRGWNPGPIGGYYASTQETQFQQGPPPGAEEFPGSHSYEQQPEP
ncbi:hypothetical protein ANO14919_127080 [Xylariales sp. No.14919]|nr:hypothetical protein ANO14919_127080 [Xylariales sp. No.14919]